MKVKAGYDIIGDTHGFADQHEELLAKFGYKNFIHPKGRKLIYLGDGPNRGAQQKRNHDLYRAALEAGHESVLGNHELKAILYLLRNRRGRYLRPHTEENVMEHARFLYDFPFGSEEHQMAIRLYQRYPVLLRKKEFNVIHAFWSADAIKTIQPYLNANGTLKQKAYEAYTQPGHKQFHDALALLLKGPVYPLPPGASIINSKGEIKTEARYFWWRDNKEEMASLADHGDQFVGNLDPDQTEQFLSLKDTFRYAAKKPLFIGHYNLLTQPDVENPQVLCLNYKDHVVGYRWNEGDKGFDPAKLVCV